MCLYTMQCGSYERRFAAKSNYHAIKIAEKWIRIFWGKYVRTLDKNSLAFCLATEAPVLTVGEHEPLARGVYSLGCKVIHRRPVDTISGF